MRRHLRIYRMFVVSSFNRELEFRANFFAKMVQNVMWIGFAVAIVLVVFANTKSIAGWSQPTALVLTGTAAILTSLSSGLFFSLMEIPQQVRQGTLDFVVTKPVDAQMWVSTRRVNFDQLGPLCFGIALLAYGLHAAGVHPALGQWLAWFGLVVAALAMFYSLSISLMTLAIWLVRVDNLWVLTETAASVSRTPVDVYPIVVQRFFLYFLPLAFFATLPAKMLILGVDGSLVLLGAVWGIGSLLASRMFWKYATRHYASASS
ncbi:MAG TPA: ABC-2 family transporter protein [Fimbriimonadaceae bacterium]|nr:ABC-2 family transporter protein [Fimbriimonadaceae bacterium]